MDPMWWWIIGGLVVVPLVVIWMWLRWRQRWFEREDERLHRLQLETEKKWHQAVARHRATTIGNEPTVPRVPPTEADPKA